MSSAYLVPIHAPPSPVASVVLFHHAGSHANYFAGWRHFFPEDVAIHAVQLPGRMSRAGQVFDVQFSDTARKIAAAIQDCVHTDALLFGHSLGGLLAYVTGTCLQRAGWPHLRGLGLSGCASPQWQRHRGLHLLDESQWLSRILAYGGVPKELMQDPDLLAFFLPPLKADLLLLDRFSLDVQDIHERLDVPLQAFYGVDDPVAGQGLMAGWAQCTSAEFSLTAFPGHHFFVAQAAPALCAALTRTLGLHGRARLATRAA